MGKQKVPSRVYWSDCTWLVCISSVAGPKYRENIHAWDWLAQKLSFIFSLISNRLFRMPLPLASCFWMDFFLWRNVGFSPKDTLFFLTKPIVQFVLHPLDYLLVLQYLQMQVLGEKCQTNHLNLTLRVFFRKCVWGVDLCSWTLSEGPSPFPMLCLHLISTAETHLSLNSALLNSMFESIKNLKSILLSGYWTKVLAKIIAKVIPFSGFF